VPIVVVPAMHEPMYDHPGVLDALDQLETWGVEFVDPRIEEGKAKIAAEDAIVTAVARTTGDRPLAGRQVLVTSGATTESLDPIRTLSNRASGRTGRAVARACVALGAEAVLVHDGPDVPWAETVAVESAAEMLDAVQEHAADADALVSAAAISDYTTERQPEKIRSGQDLTLDLEPTPKLLDTVREDHPDLAIVGFKAETDADEEALLQQARDLQERVNLEFVVGNNARVMGTEETRALVVDGEDVDEVSGSKQELGLLIARRLAERLD
jgi:phosphopantothenoylcysteine decarboxylase/phosphopantothenate--cysteine ligase